MFNFRPTLWFSATAFSGLTSLLITFPCQAATLTYDFAVNVLNGPLSGDTFMGSLSFNDTNFTRVGIERLGQNDNDLQIAFNFLGQIFDEQDESNELFGRVAPFPHVLFNNGEIVGLSYRVDEVRGTNLTPIPSPVQDFTILGPGFGYRTNDNVIFLGGQVNYTLRSSSNPPSVPEPGLLIGLVCLGLCGFSSRDRMAS